jgi:Protein O-mannosyl-transferase TMEM260-like
MLRGDSGEFQWAMAALNVAHATGYPLFTLIGYGWQLIPLTDNVAFQLNLLAPFFGALAITTIFVLIRSVTGRMDAALIGAIFFALTSVLWFNASILEVYTLHAFLLTLILYLLWLWAQEVTSPNPSWLRRKSLTAPDPSLVRRGDAALYLAFFCLGLALAHHRLIVLALPGLIYFLFATDHRFLLNVPRLLVCLVLLLPGLVLYLYVPLRLLPEGFSLDFALYDIILGREYAGSLLREINPLPVLVEIPWRNFHVGLILALLGAVTLFRRARHFNIALWLIYGANVVFALVYSVPDVQVFLTSSFVVTALWIGAGTAWLLEWVGGRLGSANARWTQTAAAAGLLLVALFGLIRCGEIQTAVAGEAAPEARARAIAASNLPMNTFLELDWETATALRFLQTTEGLRPDLETRLIEMNRADEYRRALANVAAGRAVFVEAGVKWSRAPAGFRAIPAVNDLVRIVEEPVEMTRLRAEVDDYVELIGYHSTPEALTLYWRVKKPLRNDLSTFVHYLDAQGEKVAQDDRAACCEAVYGYRTSEWEAGQIYADVFKPAPPNAVSFLVGMYSNANGDIEPYGEEIAIKP